ncbi:TIMELESS-interacting protein [Pristis pectinata]|uniref:TIMELESS-interacting protein n=1 Tax=Pristis pectinata TaxID=685728 RepID=UPI00223D8FE1|nr:TIMELESS-interacting protein [Pristis pectinata]XP_051896557.1 TIMELESS-interacting protein [Pristis pectinata]XP_051896558.1 TIMELESS-interacting protein [Pristis pectinata]XP_051896559.1 TIMELESS-interacting protein [Pristis pectinata]
MKSVRRPQPKLDAQRLTSDRGLPALRNLFDGVRFKGKGHETCLKKIRLDIPITTEDFTSNEAVENEDWLQTDNFETSFNAMPSQPVAKSTPCPSTLSEEQQLRIERNKRLALERRQARLQLTNQTPSNDQGDSQCLSQSMEANETKMVLDSDMLEDENVKNKTPKEVTKTAPSEPLSEFQVPTDVSLAVETPKDLEEINKIIDSYEPTDNSETTEGH